MARPRCVAADRASQLIELIYEGTASRDRWQDFLAALAEAGRFHAAMLRIDHHDERSLGGHEIEPAALARYGAH